MTIEARFDGQRITAYLNGHRLPLLWGFVGAMAAVIAWDLKRGWE